MKPKDSASHPPRDSVREEGKEGRKEGKREGMKEGGKEGRKEGRVMKALDGADDVRYNMANINEK